MVCCLLVALTGVWSALLNPPADYAAFRRDVRPMATYVCADFDVEVYSQANGPDTHQRVMMAVPHGLKGKAPCVIVPFYFPEAMLGFNPADGSADSPLAPKGTNLTYYSCNYMSDLARRGYITLSADAAHLTYLPSATTNLTTGPGGAWEKFGQALAEDWPTWSGVGKLVFDTRLLVDLAVADPRVDPARIGMIGHSLGGKMAFCAGLTDPRVKAVVASDFGLGWAQTNWEDAWYWGKRLAVLRSQGLSNVDILDQSNGKPFCLIAGLYDDADSGRMMKSAKGYVGHPERLRFVRHGTGHRPPRAATEAGYAFLERFVARPETRGDDLKRVPADFNVVDFGAKGDGRTKVTVALQRAIDAAEAAGGGRVVVSNGWFVSGTIFLKDGVELHIDRSARLLASPDRADYNAADVCPQNWASKGDNTSGGHLIMAVGRRNVSITGKGTVDGNVRSFLKLTDGSHPSSKHAIPWRPGQMIFLAECEGVRLRDVRLVNSPYWTCFLYGCEDVAIDGLVVRTVREPHTYNGDGIDIDACRHVLMRDCDIDTADDSITFRASGTRLQKKDNVCEDVTIERCLLSSDCNAVRVGVGSGTVRRVRVRDCRIHNSRIGICFVAGYTPDDAGTAVEDVVFEDVDVTARQFLVAYHRFTQGHTFRNISFARVHGKAEWASRLYADPRYPFENFTFEDVCVPAGVEAVNVRGLRVTGGDFPQVPVSSARKDELNARFQKNDYPIFSPVRVDRAAGPDTAEGNGLGAQVREGLSRPVRSDDMNGQAYWTHLSRAARLCRLAGGRTTHFPHR